MGNVCGLMGNADANPSNDNQMPSGIAADDDNILGMNLDFLKIDFNPSESGKLIAAKIKILNIRY